MRFNPLKKILGLLRRRAEPPRPDQDVGSLRSQTFEQTMDQHGWLAVARNDIHSTHIIPVNDMGTHRPDNRCWCNPELDDTNSWVHNAQDGREEYEQGRLLQ